MLLKNHICEVSINKISKLTKAQDFDFVYDFEGYSNEELKNILNINIVSSNRTIKIALFCDFCGSYESCSILKQDKLIVAIFCTIYEIDLLSGKARHVLFKELAGILRKKLGCTLGLSQLFI